jgi:uncharacterized protein YyaL (SSP411 family)
MSESFNRLAGETSPYLRQHKDNPVHWWPWGDAAFAAAAALDRPVLLSVGYAACHWCHVMAHESFESEAIAAQMNALFVCIKVDREERPDVDAIYMKALQMLGEQGGWPLTMFLTPDRLPIWGGTYFPPASRYGRPGFGEVLNHISRIWTTSRDKALGQGRGLAAALAEQPKSRASGDISLATLDEVCTRLLDHVDERHGGLDGAPKFPMPFVWQTLWRAFARTGDGRFKDAVTTTLDRICQGGIYDHLGGGFARYSTDALWLVPHFEKMLYDNALLLELMADVYRDTRDSALAARADETVAWLDREMTGENGAYTAALDADSEGEEGKFYVWSKAEVDAALGPDAALFAAAYDVTPKGNWEGRSVLNRNAARGMALTPDDERRLAAARARLFAVRAPRIRPGRDDKVLADWNGMAITGLAAAAAAFDRPAWLQRARDIFSAVCDTMSWRDADGRVRLAHSLCGGRRQNIDLLDDYAHMIRAALAMLEATGDDVYLARAESWASLARDLFWDADHGGYFFSPAGAEDLIVRTRTAHDSATPAGNGVMAANLARLYLLTGGAEYQEMFDRTMAAFAAEALESFPHGAALLNAFDQSINAVHVVLVSEQGDGAALAARAALAGIAEPNLVIQAVDDTARLPAGHPASGKVKLKNAATFYVCRGRSCSAPVTTIPALVALVQRADRKEP